MVGTDGEPLHGAVGKRVTAPHTEHAIVLADQTVDDAVGEHVRAGIDGTGQQGARHRLFHGAPVVLVAEHP
jgi:hypothetical protein